MPHDSDEPIYRTFEEFEREELRRADSVGAAVDELFDAMLSDELDFDGTAVRLSKRYDADDEE